ncbi:hypothetical protein DY000_02010625, partial [Brassica cretica]
LVLYPRCLLLLKGLNFPKRSLVLRLHRHATAQVKEEAMEVLLACVISGTLFTVFGSGSFWILWAVNWRLYR